MVTSTAGAAVATAAAETASRDLNMLRERKIEGLLRRDSQDNLSVSYITVLDNRFHNSRVTYIATWSAPTVLYRKICVDMCNLFPNVIFFARVSKCA